MQAGGELLGLAENIAGACTKCGACSVHCAFLKEYGLPKDTAESLLQGASGTDPFHCSLCGLCNAMCPEGLRPMEMYTAMRRQAHAREAVDLNAYATILGYEKRGASALFSSFCLPEGCSSVFFPGCTLPGTRPWTVEGLFGMLRGIDEGTGIILHCCFKPSHDLGRADFFQEHFQTLRRRLLDAGVRQVLTACPNCRKVFAQYGEGLKTMSVWRYLLEKEARTKDAPRGGEPLLLHDPCPMRSEDEECAAVFELLQRRGLAVQRLKKNPHKTLCCGEGGSVPFVRPEFARAWKEKLAKHIGGGRVVSSCAGCVGMLEQAGADSLHVGDLITDPEAALHNTRRPARSPWTYLHRLRLKRRLAQQVKKAAT
jgi:Fe-S oxidoreductase